MASANQGQETLGHIMADLKAKSEEVRQRAALDLREHVAIYD